MITPFTFKGKIGRAPYAAWSVAIFLSQYLIPLATGNLLKSDVWNYLIPHRALYTVGGNTDLMPALGAAYLLIVAWALAGLAFRRANDANVGGWVAVFAITPIIQILTILVLCVAPSATEREPSADAAHAEASEPISIWASAVVGGFAGVGLTLVAVALGTLVFGTYGGVAYPLRGELRGEGVGAERLGEFSTGTAIERVTEWVPDRKLAFVVVRDIPGMRELSPYEHVHAPHVIGYFRTTYTSFELVRRSDGGTDIIERTSHELRLDPVPYWLPMARWIVRQNNARVLEHIRIHAERGARS